MKQSICKIQTFFPNSEAAQGHLPGDSLPNPAVIEDVREKARQKAEG